MTLPSWWVEGAVKVIDQAKKHIVKSGQKWDPETCPKPDLHGISTLRGMLSIVPNGDQKSSPVFLLEQDCRKLLEWRDGGR